MIEELVIEPNPLPPFKVLYDLPVGTWLVINIGGRGGGKSHETAKFCTIKPIVDGSRIAVMRDEKTTIKESILNDIKNHFKTLDEGAQGFISTEYKMTESELKRLGDNQSLIFTKGFKASSNDKETNLKSISDIDIALIEEFEDLRDEMVFNRFADGIRKKGSFILINSNVPDKNHWFVKRYFTLEKTEYDGYFKLIPKSIEGVVYIFSSFDTNPHLQPHTIAKYKGYGDPNSPFYDMHYYLTQILGYCSSGRTGSVYGGWERITKKEYYELDYFKSYYLDWGTNDPCAIGEVKSFQDIRLVNPLHYAPIKSELEVGIKLAQLGFTTKEVIICDNSQPDWIKALRRGWDESNCDVSILEKYPALRNGFTAVGVKKGAGSVEHGIRLMRACKVFIIEGERGDEAWGEYIDYVWEQDKNGNSTNQPIDKNNHHLDGIRYTEMRRVSLIGSE